MGNVRGKGGDQRPVIGPQRSISTSFRAPHLAFRTRTMRIIAVIKQPAVFRQILKHLSFAVMRDVMRDVGSKTTCGGTFPGGLCRPMGDRAVTRGARASPRTSAAAWTSRSTPTR